MKRIITLLVLLTTSLFYAQTNGITYQAVIYNPTGEILPGNNNSNAVLSNTSICLRFSIKDAATNLEYQETQSVKTDEFGMVNLVIGLGKQIGGYAANFGAIVWNSSTKKLLVAIDISGSCSSFMEISEQNFEAVPFAYASKTSESVSGIVPIVNGGTGSNTELGAKINLGINNVDNTSDVNKPISNATLAVLDLKENTSNKSTNTALGTSNILFPTQNAVKTYVDTQLSLGGVNTNYLDSKIGGSGTINYLPKFNSANQLGNSSLFDNGTNVGIGTITPNAKFEVLGDINSRNTTNSNSILLNTSLSSLDITSSSRMFRFGSYTGSSYRSLVDGTVYVAGVSGISQLSMNTPGSQPITFATNDWVERMRIQPTTGNVGVGTMSPTSKLEVNGAATNTTALNTVAGTTIDFSKSNLAYTTASAGVFTLTNIKDGGTFTLAVQGVNSGISTFTCSGFTFRYVNNGITSVNKHTLYTFLVMGTTVYVYMATGF